MLLTDDFLAECKDLAFSIAPELHARPLFVVRDEILGDVPRPTRFFADAIGWASPGIEVDFSLAAKIPGFRPGAIIALTDEIEDLETAKCTFIHELAHVVPAPDRIATMEVDYLYSCGSALDTPERRDFEAAKFDLAASTYREIEIGGEFDPHNGAWVRRAIHLWSRARAYGWKSQPCLFSADSWWLSQEGHYVCALHDELLSMRSATFAEIEATDPPEPFADLYRHNVETYRSYRQPRTAAPQP